MEELLTTTVREKLNSNDGSEVQRAKSPLIRLLQTTADRFKRNIETNNSKAKKYRKELTVIPQELKIELISRQTHP